MSLSLTPLTHSSSLTGVNPALPQPRQLAASEPQLNFQQLLMSSLSETNRLEHQAQQNVETRLLGGDITSSEVYTSLRKSEMALKMMMQVRNKLLDAYQEIQQMRI